MKSPRSPLLDDIVMSEMELSHSLSLQSSPSSSSSSSSSDNSHTDSHSNDHNNNHNNNNNNTGDLLDDEDLPPPGPPLFYRQNAYYNEHSSTTARINRGEFALPMN